MKNYIIKENETLRDIAYRELGDANLWVKIALLNNLTYPYIGIATAIENVSGAKNVLLWSEDFTQSSWVVNGGATVSKDVEISPAGVLTADKVLNLGLSGFEDLHQIVSVENVNYEPSIYIKKITTDGICELRNPSGSGLWLINFSMLSIGWERITRENPAVVVCEDFLASCEQVKFALSSGEVGKLFDFYLWGAQLEKGSVSNEYVRTLGYIQQYSDVKSVNAEGNIVTAGDIIILPSDDEQQNEKIYFTERNVNQHDYERILLGVDIGLENRKLVMVGGVNGNDLYTKAGTDNIEQAVKHKFTVRKGNLYYYPTYGTNIMDYIGKVSDYNNIEIVKAICSNTVLQDSRVKNITEINTETDFDHINIEIHADLIGDITTGIKVQINPQKVEV